MGGSFNPAHAGHRHISLLALRHLALDQVWWMVTPQNPLKTADGMAPFRDRLASAAAMARHPRMIATDIEHQLGTRFTADTVMALRRRFPATRFVWLMGADNLRQIPAWDRWQDIFRTIPIAVFARPPYSHAVLHGLAAQRYARHRLPARQRRGFASRRPPAWIFLHTRRYDISATAIRQQTIQSEVVAMRGGWPPQPAPIREVIR